MNERIAAPGLSDGRAEDRRRQRSTDKENPSFNLLRIKGLSLGREAETPALS